MASTTIYNNTTYAISTNAICFRDPNWYEYSDSSEAYCEELIWSKEYLNMASSIIIGILGFYQLTWENHNFPIIRFISGLLIFCSISSLLNHYHNTRTYMLLENFTIYLIQYIMLSIILEKYCRNIQIVLNKEDKWKFKMTQTKSQILTGINWTFSTFFIYFGLYRDVNGCDWGTWVYKFIYVLPIIIQLLFVGIFHYFNNKYEIKFGTITHNKEIAKTAFNYYQSGVSLLFIGLFTWILMHSTCIPNSGIEYIPAHFIWHLLFAYGIILISQYYIFITNDIDGNRMILSSRSTNSNIIINILFPYFMKFKGIFKQETERMLNDIQPAISTETLNINPIEIKDLRKSIETLNRERKTRKLNEKLRKQNRQNIQRKIKYDDFDVNDYMENVDKYAIHTMDNDMDNNMDNDMDKNDNEFNDTNQIELQTIEDNQKTINGNDIQEEDGFGVTTP
eukprot:167749_1